MFLSSLIWSMSGLATGSVPDDKSMVRILLAWGIPGEEGDMVVQVYLDRNIFNAVVEEWKTHCPQKAVSAKVCEFDSRSRHFVYLEHTIV